MIKKFNTYINESLKDKMVGKSKEELSPDNKDKYDIIMYINDAIEKYGRYITMGTLEADSSPIIKEDYMGIHLVEALDTIGVKVIVYSGYDNQDEVAQYTINYFKLDISILEEIKNLLEIAIEFELLEEDI